MALNLNVAMQYGLCVRAAEAVEAGNAPDYQPPPGFSVIQPLFANDLATQITPVTDFVPMGFVAQCDEDQSIVVAIRGTAHIFEWIDDAQFFRVACPVAGGAGTTEDGFSDVYSSLRIAPYDAAETALEFLQSLGAQMSLTICGHSLGAAIATLLAYDLSIHMAFSGLSLFTYASPNVGDGAFAQDFGNKVPDAWRIVNPFDVITHVPTYLLLGYESVGQTYAMNPAGRVELDLFCFHHLTTYLHLLSLAANAVPIPLDPECVPGP